jgi:hypothetical protein
VASSNNPYTPPRAPLQENPSRGRGSPWKALLFGVITDIGGTLVAVAVLSVLAALTMGEAASDPETFRTYFDSGLWQMLQMVVGSLCTLLGGYVAARIANHAEYRYAAVCGLLALALTELFASFLASGADNQDNFGLRVAGWIVTVPLAMLGARWRLHQKALQQADGPGPGAEPPAGG